MTPHDFLIRLREILSDECRCKACWAEHPHPLSSDEIRAIRSRILHVLDVLSLRERQGTRPADKLVRDQRGLFQREFRP
jgi:hypothetical protein